MHLKVGDVVQIVRGEDRPRTAEDRTRPSGKILRVDRESRRVIVEGCNMVTKHLKRSEQNPQGGRVKREAPVPASNVMLFNAESKKPERVSFKRVNGKRVRYFKSTNTVVDE